MNAIIFYETLIIFCSQTKPNMSDPKDQTTEWKALPPPVSQEPYNISTYEWSDEEQEGEEAREQKYQFDITRWYDMKLLFGKYKGLNLKEMVLKRERRRYLRWLAGSDFKLYGNQRECVQEALRYAKCKKTRRKATIAMGVFK